jgi:hypothetical protein
MSGDGDGVRAQLGRFARDDPDGAGHFIGRFIVLRLLGLVYLMAFLTLVSRDNEELRTYLARQGFLSD